MDNERKNAMNGGGICTGAYGLAIIGSAVYFIQHATSFWGGVLGFLKALVWPAFLIHKVLEMIKL
ncbi:MAG: hypothetical protein AABZ39_10735 [Spirochaetota bacterium]